MKKEKSKLTPEQQAELETLAALPDAKINMAAIPENWSGARRGLFADERAAIAASKSAAARGEFASDEQVRATWAKHGL